MQLPTLDSLVKGNKITKFSYSRDGTLWYKVENFEYPVSPEEQKGGTWTAEEKAIRHMRWIRKHLEFLKESMRQACLCI